MDKINLKNTPGFVQALKLCADFERCGNYPKDKDGVDALAVGLLVASTRTGVEMAKIARECSETSMFCPTDFDLLSVAKGIAGPPEVETIPAPRAEEVSRQWKSLETTFPKIAENGRSWHEEFREVCSRVRTKLGGADAWDKASNDQKIAAALALGMLPHGLIRDAGLAVFVKRREL